MLRKVLSAIVFLVFAAPEAQAKDDVGNFFVAPSLFYHSGLRSRSSKDKEDYLVYELKAAYNAYEGLFTGLSYQVETEEKETSGYASASLNASSKSTRTSMGPTVGYVATTFHVLLTYFFDSKWKLDTTTSGGTNKYEYSGTGLQLDLGYKIELWKTYFGPQISYKKFEYKKLAVDGGSEDSISPKLEDSSLEPSLVFFFFF